MRPSRTSRRAIPLSGVREQRQAREEPTPPAVAALPSVVYGTLAQITARGGPRIDYEGRLTDAESLVAITTADLGRRCALAFEGGNVARPLIIGLLWQPGVSAGFVIEAAEHLTLRCGRASLELAADGNVRLKGVTVTTQAYGANRIKGGSVHLN